MSGRGGAGGSGRGRKGERRRGSAGTDWRSARVSAPPASGGASERDAAKAVEPGGGFRADKSRLRSAKKRKPGSARWLQRQINDPFVQLARKEGFRARSVYKLAEIDERFGLLRPGTRTLDLGAAPGSWSQYAARNGATIVAVDLLPIEPIEGVITIEGDFLDPRTLVRIEHALAGPVDLILSDMAPDATGTALVDRLRVEAVGDAVLDVAHRLLQRNGRLLLKLTKGAEGRLVASARERFTRVRLVKPQATRQPSSEIFLLGEGLLPGPPQQY